jgi:nucleotide-binding universal stress UspA family protein
MFKHILIPTDGSDLSQRAVVGAIELAQALKADITAYCCIFQYPYTPFAEVLPEQPGEFHQRMQRDAKAHLDRVEAAALAAGVPFKGVISAHQAAYEGIIEAAEANACDVIFMASHGRRGLSSLLIGSETQRVLTHSKIPVIVYR